MVRSSSLKLKRLENRLRVEDGVADPAKAISVYLDWLGDVVAGFKLNPTKVTQAPSLDVDKVWQRHQLDTRAYTQDCRALFGDAHLPEREVPHYVHRSVGTCSEHGMSLGAASVDALGVPTSGKIRLNTRAAVRVEELMDPTRAVADALPIKQRWCAKSTPLGQISLANVDDTAWEYARWLELLAAEGAGTRLSPSKLVDEVWHAHILDSRAYSSFCLEHYSVYVHHEPSYEKSHAFHQPAFDACLLKYKEHFGQEPPASHWAVMGESGGGGGDGGNEAPPPPPKLPPPELLDATTGTVYLPLKNVSLEPDSSRWRCCYSYKAADLVTDLYGPDNIDHTDYRITALVPEKLREKGIDQNEYAAMLEDIKSTLSAELYRTIPLCGFPCCCLQLVMAPLPSINIKDTVENAIAARARVWRDEHGMNTSIIPVERWLRSPMPNANWSGWESKPDSWSGYALVFAPPGTQSMSYEEAWNAAPPSTNAQKFALWKHSKEHKHGDIIADERTAYGLMWAGDPEEPEKIE